MRPEEKVCTGHVCEPGGGIGNLLNDAWNQENRLVISRLVCPEVVKGNGGLKGEFVL
jgi:hypothetical protein